MYRIRYKKSFNLGYLTAQDLSDSVTLGYRWNLKILECQISSTEKIIWVVNHNVLNHKFCPRIAAELQLERASADAWQVNLAVVDREFRGEDLACKIYKYLIRQGMTLQAGASQSPGGRYIWYRLAQSRSIEIVGRRKWGRELVRMRPNHDAKEIYHPDFECYSTDRDSIVYARAA